MLIKPQYKIFSLIFAFSLCGGTSFAPFYVKADNSQSGSMALEANVSSLMADQSGNNNNPVKSDAKVNILSDNALLPATTPATPQTEGMDDGSDLTDQISFYVVGKGDSIKTIADTFNISVNTILLANQMKPGDKLVEGQVLMILPVNGVDHTVVAGDTLKKIAEKYKVDVADIAWYNNIAIDAKLTVGQELVIPGAEVSAPATSGTNAKNNSKVRINSERIPMQNISGYFINPVPGYIKRTQGLHANNGVDLAAHMGAKIVAAASGTVIFANTGWDGGYGNMVIINHPNGTQTLYGHMEKVLTHVGARVGQGDTIGLVGSTGRSTGPHCHYEVHGAPNNAKDL